jgi:hypothetical protein
MERRYIWIRFLPASEFSMKSAINASSAAWMIAYREAKAEAYYESTHLNRMASPKTRLTF